ncbi:MAG TPA: YbdK family carboxylate-amine ligase [Baekduia sp.]
MATAANTSSADALRAAFARHRALTVGLEEEVMLLDPDTLDLAPVAADVLRTLDGDARFKPELPAAQLEIAGAPAITVTDAARELARARADLVAATTDRARPAAAGVHPFTHGVGALAPGPRYRALLEDYGAVIRRQLVFGLHVHVAVGGATRALSVYNALREHLPALAALGAGSPFYEGRDTGLASVRPVLCDLLPRQGIPPLLPDWETYALALQPAPAFADARWWWEARPHPVYGTLEVRVVDAQPTVAATAALAAVVHALVATLCAQHDDGTLPDPAPSWRIEENRWSACRHGVAGSWTDVRTGAVRRTAEHVEDLLALVAPAADRLGCAAELAAARALLDAPPAATARRAGPHAHAANLAERFAQLGMTGAAAG